MPVPRSDGTASPGGIPEGEFRQQPAQAVISFKLVKLGFALFAFH